MKTKKIFKGFCNKNDEYLVGLWAGLKEGYLFCSCRKIYALPYKFDLNLKCCKNCINSKGTACYKNNIVQLKYCHDIFLFEENEC